MAPRRCRPIPRISAAVDLGTHVIFPLSERTAWTIRFPGRSFFANECPREVCGFASRSIHRVPEEQKSDPKTVGRIADSDRGSEMQDMIHFGLKLMDDHAIKCSELLKDLAGAKDSVEEAVDHMRSQWICFSVEKQEALLLKDAVIFRPAAGNISSVYVGESSSRVAAANDKKMALLKAESGKLVFKHITATSSLFDDSVNRAGHEFPFPPDQISQSVAVSVLSPKERKIFFTPADPVAPAGLGFLEQLDDIMQSGGVSVLTPEERAFYATPAAQFVHKLVSLNLTSPLFTSQDDHGLARADMLNKLLNMPGNTGDLPTFLTGGGA